jgi:phosphate-selective porin OprO/OprP
MVPHSARSAGAFFTIMLTALVLVPNSQAQAPQQTGNAFGPAPSSSNELEKRVQELEETVRQLQASKQSDHPKAKPDTVQPATHQEPETTQGGPTQGSGPESPAPETGAGPELSLGQYGNMTAGWRDGFYIQSEDRDFVLRITGQIQADYRAFPDEKDATDVDTFLMRRVRLGIEADMAQYYEFRLLPDFAQGKFVLQDAYMNIHYWDPFQFEVGKFKQPFSYEQLIQDRFVPTVERSMIDQLVPARDEGVMIHGRGLFDGRLDYAIAVSNGEINGDIDTNEPKDLNGRLAFMPFNSEEIAPVLQRFEVGISGGFGVEQEPMMPSILRTPATIPWFAFNSGVTAAGVRWRMSPEVSYFYEGLGFAAQYFRQEQDIRAATSGAGFSHRPEVPFDGWYVMGSYLITGESRTTYSQAVKPLRPFDPYHPCSCPGAIELIVRASELEVGEVAFVSGAGRLADPTKYSHEATELTLGFNWYLNEWFRVQFNYEHDWFANPVLLGSSSPANLTKSDDALLTRFQIIF